MKRGDYNMNVTVYSRENHFKKNTDEKNKELLKDKVLIGFYSKANESSDRSDFELEKVAKYAKAAILIDMEDVDNNESYYLNKSLDKNESLSYQELINKCHHRYEEDTDLLIPNYKGIFEIYDFIEEHMGENFITACSAGISRSGQTATYLIERGYNLVDNGMSHTHFATDGPILNMLRKVRHLPDLRKSVDFELLFVEYSSNYVSVDRLVVLNPDGTENLVIKDDTDFFFNKKKDSEKYTKRIKLNIFEYQEVITENYSSTIPNYHLFLNKFR